MSRHIGVKKSGKDIIEIDSKIQIRFFFILEPVFLNFRTLGNGHLAIGSNDISGKIFHTAMEAFLILFEFPKL